LPEETALDGIVPDYVATMPFAEGVAKAIEWFEADARRQQVDKEYNRFLDAVIAGYEKAL